MKAGAQKLDDSKRDEFVKSPFGPIFVIPAKAGIQLIRLVLDSCFRRSDGFPEIIKREGKRIRRPGKITLSEKVKPWNPELSFLLARWKQCSWSA